MKTKYSAPDTQPSPKTGRNGRSPRAEFAGAPLAQKGGPQQPRRDRRLALFAQFPPAALFAAMSRGVARRSTAGGSKHGMGIALKARRPAAGGT
jgi:hypothetical protein